ncbi:Interleukin-6 receptor subunit alpha [Tupaia chinensis]|uniref:Interleukin-6 receptor subunit alpha n=1 Tax=Tupaia chinensis TaxID=246437 RepID=L9KHQ5_TUPCH|nr:Interleukin-6 receptor subunit alpha [Tupaia chinensis]
MALLGGISLMAECALLPSGWLLGPPRMFFWTYDGGGPSSPTAGAIPPEEPQPFCFRRSPISSIECAWSPQRAPSTPTTAVLLWGKLQDGYLKDFQEPCPYVQEAQQFSCQLEVREADSSFYSVSLCVANSVGSKASEPHTFEIDEILKPDPPANVTIFAVARNPHKLLITWKYPHTWNSFFYKLRFELRYRAEHATTFTRLMVKTHQHYYVVRDAWSGTKHTVQLRAQEEFGNGMWSGWSTEVTGVPWAESGSVQAEAEWSLFTEGPATDDHDNVFPRDYVNATTLPVQDTSSVSLPTFLVAGGSLAFGMLLCIGVILRFKKTWKLQALKEGKTSILPLYSLGQLVPERPKPTLVLVPLISPPVSPSSPGSDNTLSHSRPDARDPRSPYDISNRDYFFPR